MITAQNNPHLPPSLPGPVEVICMSRAICCRSDIGAVTAGRPDPPDPVPDIPRGLDVEGIPLTSCARASDVNKRKNERLHTKHRPQSRSIGSWRRRYRFPVRRNTLGRFLAYLKGFISLLKSRSTPQSGTYRTKRQNLAHQAAAVDGPREGADAVTETAFRAADGRKVNTQYTVRCWF